MGFCHKVIHSLSLGVSTLIAENLYIESELTQFLIGIKKQRVIQAIFREKWRFLWICAIFLNSERNFSTFEARSPCYSREAFFLSIFELDLRSGICISFITKAFAITVHICTVSSLLIWFASSLQSFRFVSFDFAFAVACSFAIFDLFVCLLFHSLNSLLLLRCVCVCVYFCPIFIDSISLFVTFTIEFQFSNHCATMIEIESIQTNYMLS